MDREQMVEGLKLAIQGGNSIESAAASFKNAGYSPVEVDAAASQIQNNEFIPKQSVPIIEETRQATPKIEVRKPIQNILNKNSQKISSYGGVRKPGVGKSFLIILIIFASLIVFASLITLLFFRPELSDFISKLFP